MHELTRIYRAFTYSFDGIKAAWKDEAAFRTEIIVAAILLAVAFLLPVTAWERAGMIACLFLVLCIELINSALEAAIDRFGGELHPLSKKAKDCGSAAVLMSLLVAGCIWLGALWSVAERL